MLVCIEFDGSQGLPQILQGSRYGKSSLWSEYLLHSEFNEVPHPSSSASGGASASSPSSMRSATDLEMAVLVQELMAMREDKADLKRQAYLLEREKKALELIINSQQAQETALKSHINHMQMELDNQESLVSFSFTSFFTIELHTKRSVADFSLRKEMELPIAGRHQ